MVAELLEESPDDLAQYRENLEDAFEFALIKVASAIKDN